MSMQYSDGHIYMRACVYVCVLFSGFALPLISYQVKESWGVKTEHMPKASQMFKGAGKAN